MTGYGQARWQGEGYTIVVEARSVNGRFFKIKSRTPPELAGAEHELERVVRGRVKRGSVELRVQVELTGAGAARPVNKDALGSYIRQLQAAGERLGTALTFNADTLLALPGVLESEEMQDDERAALLGHARETLGRALDALDRMRCAEGANLRAELLGHCDAVVGQIAEIEAGHPEGIKRYAERLTERVNRLLEATDMGVSERDLAREVAIYAERSSVCEEVARLRSHVEQFRGALDQTGSIGRRLEFLAQEMQREANTMNAKVADTALSRTAIDLHGAVDKIREQVLNVE